MACAYGSNLWWVSSRIESHKLFCGLADIWSLHTRLTTHTHTCTKALALWWVIGEMVTLETFHLREAILALSQHYFVPDFSKAKRCQTNLKQIEWLYGRGREYMGMQKKIHSQNQRPPASCPVKRAAIWPGGYEDEEHKGSDFLRKQLLTTWIGRGGPGQHLAN